MPSTEITWIENNVIEKIIPLRFDPWDLNKKNWSLPKIKIKINRNNKWLHYRKHDFRIDKKKPRVDANEEKLIWKL